MLDERGYANSHTRTHTPGSVAFLVLLINQIFELRKLIHGKNVLVHYIL